MHDADIDCDPPSDAAIGSHDLSGDLGPHVTGAQPRLDAGQHGLVEPGIQPGGPRLPDRPGGSAHDPSRADLGATAIRPLEATAPGDVTVESATQPRSTDSGRPDARDVAAASRRAEPPPTAIPTTWIRLTLVGLLVAALAATLWTEYAGRAGDVAASGLVIATHGFAVVALIAWSAAAMHNANTIVPPRRYQHPSRSWLAVVLWSVAFIAPACAAAVYAGLRERLTDPDDLGAVITLSLTVLVASVLVWLPFRYHARQAARIGAPHRIMIAWFWIPLVSLVGGVLIVALGLHEELAVDGLTEFERTLQVGIVYGLPMLLLTLSTWRAVAVFDEVLELRLTRWTAEWNETLRVTHDPPDTARPDPA